MDRIALVSDVHGNVTAWRAVLAQLRADGITTIYCLGDLVGKGPDGAGVIDLCDDVCTGVVRGNWDSAMVDADLHGSEVAWYRDQLDQDRLAYLGGLANAVDLQVSGRWVRLFHASAKAETHRVFLQSPQVELDAMFVNTDFTGYDHPAPDVVAYGDLHEVFLTPAGGIGRTLLNVGSVGNPLDATTAAYVVLHGRLGSARSDGFGIEFRRVGYDVETEIKLARESGMPQVEAYARELRTSVYRGSPG
jgi:predicted phosphodiesterase